MPDNEKRILDKLEEIIPKLDEVNKAFLLGYGEGLAASVTNIKPICHESSDKAV